MYESILGKVYVCVSATHAHIQHKYVNVYMLNACFVLTITVMGS